MLVVANQRRINQIDCCVSPFASIFLLGKRVAVASSCLTYPSLPPPPPLYLLPSSHSSHNLSSLSPSSSSSPSSSFLSMSFSVMSWNIWISQEVYQPLPILFDCYMLVEVLHGYILALWRTSNVLTDQQKEIVSITAILPVCWLFYLTANVVIVQACKFGGLCEPHQIEHHLERK